MTLFARLEPNQHITIELVFMTCQNLSCAYGACQMQVVTSGMHEAIC